MSSSSAGPSSIASPSGRGSSEPRLVQEVIDAARTVCNVAQKMPSSKESSKDIARRVHDIGNCIENSRQQARHSGQIIHLSIPASSAFGMTKSVFDKCAAFMEEARRHNRIKRTLTKSETTTAIANYLAAVSALREILVARDNFCGLLDDPDYTGPDVLDTCTLDDLKLQVDHLSTEYDAFRTVLLGMANITDGLFWPLKALPQTVLQIINHVEKGRANPAHVTHLLLEIRAWWDLVAKLHNPDTKNDKLREEVKKFFQRVHGIFIRLHVLQAVHPVKAFIACESFDAALHHETTSLIKATDKLLLAQVLSSTTTVERIEGQLTELHRKFDTFPGTAKDSGVQDKVPSPFSDSFDFGTLPAAPNIFHGRDAEVRQIVEYILQHLVALHAARIAILGTGGLGKTSLALAVVHEPRIEEAFEDRRFFLTCEPCIDTNAVVATLAKLFSIHSSTALMSGIRGITAHLRGQTHTLLILDNVESVWLARGDQTRNRFERVLRHLAEIPTLTIVLTSRGIILPPDIKWSNAAHATLRTFSPEAAHETFIEVAGKPTDETQRHALAKLLSSVDYMPLAVTLLARLALRHNKPSDLLDRWEVSRHTMLQTHASNHRESSVAASIAISVKLLSSATSTKEPLQLLAICAHLPDGLRKQVLKELKPHFEDIGLARQCIVDFALVSVGTMGELKMLSPVRHFILNSFPVTDSHLKALRSIYCAIAATAPRAPAPNLTARSAQVSPEYGNLNSLLLHLVNKEEPSQDLMDAVEAISDYASAIMFPTLTLWQAMHARLVTSGHQTWLATCLLNIGQLHGARSEFSEAIAVLSKAQKMYEALGDRSKVAFCLRNSGVYHRMENTMDTAEAHLMAAQKIFIDIGDDYGSADCRAELGEICFDQQKNDDMATQYLSEARDFFVRAGYQSRAATCLKTLGRIYHSLDDLEMAEEALREALAHFETEGDDLSAAATKTYLSEVKMSQHLYKSAERLLNEAHPILMKFRSSMDLGNNFNSWGTLRWRQRRYEEAINYMEQAINMYRAVNSQVMVEDCERQIRDFRKEWAYAEMEDDQVYEHEVPESEEETEDEFEEEWTDVDEEEEEDMEEEEDADRDEEEEANAGERVLT
ncbi:hypothetical protein BKA62DRAFT_782342 [Auriculariales sp. MPI-PUGE-AT-0066]|nr:hypothetical protein BKA62DRAFT_782342 [Auriculariales sp. MPI-PUGE-AT-0066]